MPPTPDDSKTQTDQLIEEIKGAHAAEGDHGLSSMYLRVFMDAADPIVIEDLSGVVIDLNVEAAKSYGWPREDLIGKPIKQLVPEERHDQAEGLLHECLEGRPVRNVEGLRVTRDGQVIWVLLTLSLVKDQKGAPLAVASIAKDITALRQARAEADRMSRVFMDAADPIVIEDLSGIVIDLNVEAERSYGWSRDELIDQPIKRLVPEVRHAQADELLQRCLAGEDVRNIEGTRVTRDGTIIDVLLTLSLLRNEAGEPVGIASLAKDITTLRKATAEYEGLVRAINRVQAVVDFALDGTVMNANDNFLQIFGYTLDEVVGKHHKMFCDASHTESPEYIEFWKKLVRGEFETGEFKRRHKDGREVWLQASYNPVFDKDGNLIKVVKFASDITREVEARSIALMEMATPVTRIWDGVLFAPIVGVVDSRRAHDIMNKTLSSIVDQGARVLLLDIGGVGMVDTAVANHLIKIAKAAVLMGCKTIISGISPAIAQTITELGVELGAIRTTSTIESALREAITRNDTGV